MGYQLSEFVQVAHSALSVSKPPYLPSDVLSPLVRVVVVQFLFILFIVPLLLHQRIMDELIIQELIEYIQLFYQEFVESVNDCAHHTDAMGLDRV